MPVYLLKKTASLIFTLALVAVITFFIFEILPGDAALVRLGIDATHAQVEAYRAEMGLDQPVYIRLGEWFYKAFRGDFGVSTRFDQPVKLLIRSRMAVTTQLTILALLMTILIGIPISLLSAKYRGRMSGLALGVVTQIGMAVPTFWLGILATYLFGLMLGWFTPGAYVSLSENFGRGLTYLLFPALALAIPRVAVLVRYTRSSILDEWGKEYVRTGYAKGLSTDWIMYRHVLRNSLIPTLTILGMMVAEILGGALIIEQIYNIPGMGKLLIAGISGRDFPLVQGMVLYIAFLVIVIHVFLDILYKLIDPRVNREEHL